MQSVRTGAAVPGHLEVLASGPDRVKAARILAGGITLRQTANAAGLGFHHLSAIERGAHPLLDTDARDLAEVLGCPADWLRDGWG